MLDITNKNIFFQFSFYISIRCIQYLVNKLTAKKTMLLLLFVYSLYVLNTWLKQSHEVEVLPQSRVEGNRFSTFEVSKGD